jgi:hypothetical protein
MAFQGVPPKGEEKGFAPPGVEGGRTVELKRDEGADVLHRDRLCVKVKERSGLVLSNGVVEGFIVDGGEGSVVIIGVGRRWEVGCSAFPHGAAKSGTKTSIGRITVCLHRGGLTFCLSHTGECSVAGGLAGASVLRGIGGRCRPAIRMKGGGGGGRSVDIGAGHEQRRMTRWSSAWAARWRGGALEAAHVAEEKRPG